MQLSYILNLFVTYFEWKHKDLDQNLSLVWITSNHQAKFCPTMRIARHENQEMIDNHDPNGNYKNLGNQKYEAD